MAIRYAVANGFADVAATWDGGTLPASTDDLYANNFTVSIRADLTANSIKKIANASPVIAVGGSFVITAAATVTITAGIAATDNVTNTTNLLTVDAGAAAVTINASLTGGVSTARVACVTSATYTGTLTVNGNITGGGGATSALGLGINGGATLLLTGTISGGSAGYGLQINSAAARVTVAGDVYGGGAGAFGIRHISGALTVRGDIYPGSFASGTPAISSDSVFRYSGHIYSGGMAASTGPDGFFPIAGRWSAISGEEVYVHVYDDGNYPSGNNGTARVLTRYGTDLPDQADVRDGVAYGPSAALAGSLAVPPPESVAAGVPTDDTVGTAAVSLADVLAGTGAQIAAATSG